MSRRIKAVFFDAGGTLFRPFPSVGEIYARTARLYGANCDPQMLETEFQLAWQKRGGLSSLGTETNEAKERAWWYSLVREVFKSQGGVPRFDEFFEVLHHSFEEKHLWEIYPDVGAYSRTPLLLELRERGFILGIVSNWDLRLPKLVRNLGLLPYFDFVLSSSMCGATKPSAKIFNEALKRSGATPSETIHVGDTYEEDFIGADRAGITALLLDRAGSGNSVLDEARITSLKELIGRI